MPAISGQSIIIIGGSSGIGFGAAKLALADGVRVAIVSSNPNRVANAVERLKSSYPDGQIAGYDCDLKLDGVESRLEKLFTDVTTANGGLLDHVIYTAGDSLAIQDIQKISIESIHQAGHLRFVAPLLVAKIAPRFLKQSSSSSLILTGGIAADQPRPNWTVVSAFSSGLHGMTRNLAVDLKPIRVNLVSPGAIDTELWGPNREQLVAEQAKRAFLGKIGTIDEVGESYIYLMKDTNATGSIVRTTGGGQFQQGRS